MPADSQRYTAVAIVLHWAIAFAILFMIPLGFWMHEATEHPETVMAGTAAFQLHKSIGLTILALSLVRLGWRLTHRPPSFPAAMPAWEKAAALAVHWGFYVLMIVIPFTGWLYISTAWSAHDNQPLPVTTRWFDLFRVPPLFDLPHASVGTRRSLAGLTMDLHAKLAWAMLVLATVHVAAALKHQFVNRDDVLSHMVPGLNAPAAPPPKNPGRLAGLGAGFAVIALLLIAGLYSVTHLPGPTVPFATVLNQMGAAAAESLGPAGAHEEEEHSEDADHDSETASSNAPEQDAHEHAAAAPQTVRAPTTIPVAAHATPHASAGAPPAWRVDAAASSIHFSTSLTSEGVERAIQGRFDSWRADIHFDPNDLTHSSAVVTIDSSSAHDGVDFDETNLPTPDFFDTAHHPTVEFRTTSIRALGGDRYEARGTLSLKGHPIPITLPFTLHISGAHATMDGRVSLARASTGMGTGQAQANEALAANISVAVHVEATRAQ